VQKKRGEFSTDSKLLSRMIEHQEKRETHEQTMVDMRKKFELAREQQGGAKAEGAKAGARGKGGSPETAGKKVRRRQPQQEEEEDSSSTTGEEDDDSEEEEEEEEEEETTEATLRRRNPAKPK
jgi:hypothetical protein